MRDSRLSASEKMARSLDYYQFSFRSYHNNATGILTYIYRTIRNCLLFSFLHRIFLHRYKTRSPLENLVRAVMPYGNDHGSALASPPPIPIKGKGKGRAKPLAKPPMISLTEAEASIAVTSHSIVTKNASLLPSLTITADPITRNLRSTSRVRERALTESPCEMMVDGDAHVLPST
jgi:hypothetical protein